MNLRMHIQTLNSLNAVTPACKKYSKEELALMDIKALLALASDNADLRFRLLPKGNKVVLYNYRLREILARHPVTCKLSSQNAGVVAA
jgi:hypothetical protein